MGNNYQNTKKLQDFHSKVETYHNNINIFSKFIKDEEIKKKYFNEFAYDFFEYKKDISLLKNKNKDQLIKAIKTFIPEYNYNIDTDKRIFTTFNFLYDNALDLNFFLSINIEEIIPILKISEENGFLVIKDYSFNFSLFNTPFVKAIIEDIILKSENMYKGEFSIKLLRDLYSRRDLYEKFIIENCIQDLNSVNNTLFRTTAKTFNTAEYIAFVKKSMLMELIPMLFDLEEKESLEMSIEERMPIIIKEIFEDFVSTNSVEKFSVFIANEEKKKALQTLQQHKETFINDSEEKSSSLPIDISHSEEFNSSNYVDLTISSPTNRESMLSIGEEQTESLVNVQNLSSNTMHFLASSYYEKTLFDIIYSLSFNNIFNFFSNNTIFAFIFSKVNFFLESSTNIRIIIIISVIFFLIFLFIKRIIIKKIIKLFLSFKIVQQSKQKFLNNKYIKKIYEKYLNIKKQLKFILKEKYLSVKNKII